MISKTKKRSRATVEDKRADCPFELHVASFPVARTGKNGRPSKNRSKPVNRNDEKTTKANSLFQPPLFAPTGKFRSDATMGVYYHIEPRQDWTSMTRYHSFVLNSVKYLSGEFVFVANDNYPRSSRPRRAPCYARVCWMYSPDELPAGRRPYYGKNEIILTLTLESPGYYQCFEHSVRLWHITAVCYCSHLHMSNTRPP
ncbi:hypothetical protein LMH87_001372 [Akanthomyces muscarius]|uniref:Uncharacterized protein n=1 Tax=Akanthomyces muscarius TaxID=2231603 RepID=A0A9W8UI46_AKAMU|nr:hypothetical protein LMH87_001372 [Akanthomyces muscarius]KAJ4146812.1 hypothetical protein LMH87_001372 [Akanthomyces muscarius]